MKRRDMRRYLPFAPAPSPFGVPTRCGLLAGTGRIAAPCRRFPIPCVMTRSPGFSPSVTTQLAPEVRSATILRRTALRSEEHTSELQSLMRISYAVFCLKKKKKKKENLMKTHNKTINVVHVTSRPRDDQTK